jgi:hypothetical protein
MVYCLYMYVHVCVCEPLYIVWFIVYICTYMYVTYIDNKPYSTMGHRHIHVRTYIDNIPYSTMVQRNIHVRTYIDNKHVCVCELLYIVVFIVYICTYMYVSVNYCTAWFIVYICTYMYVYVK